MIVALTTTCLVPGLVVFVMCTLFHYYYYTVLHHKRRRWDLIRSIPGPKGLPLLGNIHQIKDGPDLYQQLINLSREFTKEGIFKILLSTEPITFIYKPEYVEILLNSTVNIEKSWEYRFIEEWLGTGLLTSQGNKWRTRRKMVTPTFHFRILQGFVDVFNKQSRVLVRKLEDMKDRGTFDIFNFVKYCTLDIICETAMGVNLNSQSNSTEYVKAAERLVDILNIRFRTPWLWPDCLHSMLGHGREQTRLLDTLHGFTNSVIRQRLQSFDERRTELVREELVTKDDDGDDDEEKDDDAQAMRNRKNKRLAFLDMLLFMSDNLTELTIEDIREEVDTFMFEGHDSVAVTINWTVHLIGDHPRVQREVQSELDSILGDSDRDVTIEDIKLMKYLECCIKESLRLFPTAPSFGRKLVEDLVLGKYTIPAGTTAVIFTPRSNLDPDIFPEPDEYKPERFFLENSNHRHPCSFLPFSAGPRNCIGQRFAMLEMKIVLAHVFRAFSVTAWQRRGELRPGGQITLRPQHGILVQLATRQNRQHHLVLD